MVSASESSYWGLLRWSRPSFVALISLRGSREKQGVAVPSRVCLLPQRPTRRLVLPRQGPEVAAVARLLAALSDVCDDTQFVKNFTLIREWEGEKQKPAVMRVAQKLFQVLWKRVPRGEDVLGLLVDVPQQGKAAKEK